MWIFRISGHNLRIQCPLHIITIFYNNSLTLKSATHRLSYGTAQVMSWWKLSQPNRYRCHEYAGCCFGALLATAVQGSMSLIYRGLAWLLDCGAACRTGAAYIYGSMWSPRYAGRADFGPRSIHSGEMFTCHDDRVPTAPCAQVYWRVVDIHEYPDFWFSDRRNGFYRDHYALY
jgi:hypothetical protein